MTNIINKNLRPPRATIRERLERAGNLLSAAVMLAVAAVVFTLAVVSAVAPQWLMGGV